MPERQEPERQELEALFLANLEWIERVVGVLARRYGLSADERADAASWVKLKLVEHDYAVLRKFRGASAVTTYLTTVVAMLLRDYRVQHWGRWRASAAAVRRGPIAVRLETLVYRDGLTTAQAGELLRTSGVTALTDRELAELLAALPRRTPLRPIDVGAAALEAEAAPDRPEDAVLRREAADVRRSAEAVLADALEQVTPDDRVIVRMYYWEGSSIAEIARALRLDQRPLYRRLGGLLAQLRARLEAAGVSRECVRDLLDESAA